LNRKIDYSDRVISLLQYGSMLGIWALLMFIIWWLWNSIKNAFEWHDAPTATIIITFIAMIIFILLVSILTYVFVRLRFGTENTTSSRNNEGNLADE
jgi:ABC-type maltose transport system permease subunit